jgi:4-hydroxybenzoate polyprenyltransferase/phosphoserine phosphatase
MGTDEGDAMTRPLCVDLDGTLIATDTLWESLLLLMKRRPLVLIRLLVSLVGGGRAAFKQKMADAVLPDPATLPYRPEVLAFIAEARSAGRSTHLVTAADERIARSVADHLGVFDSYSGTSAGRNLKGRRKRDYLEERFGARSFDYIGDSSADLVVWELAGRAYMVNVSPSVKSKARRLGEPVEVCPRAPFRLKPWIKELRPHQWMKNVLLFVPAILAHRYTELAILRDLILAFFAFSFCASSVYVANDLLDLESDRQHRSKKNRPLASGALTIPQGMALGVAALVAGLGISYFTLSTSFTLAVLGYIALTTVYTVYLKQKLLLDVIVLALLFTYRVIAGSIAVDVVVSSWLLAFSLFFFSGLAFVKRLGELTALSAKQMESVPGRNYQVVDLDIVKSLGPACGVASVLVMCLYINSAEVKELYTNYQLLYLIAPVLLYWIGRVWFLAGRGMLDDDPVVFAIRDRVSIMSGILAAGLLAAARLDGWPMFWAS